MPERLAPAVYRDIVRRAIEEDVGSGDLTTQTVVPVHAAATATLVAKSTAVVAGLDLVREVFEQVDATLQFQASKADGALCHPGEALARIEGSAASILTAERTALNFVQHLSGIATLARRFVDAAGGRLTVKDTRKTIPTLRALAKYAVRCGGAANHRMGLNDGILIKDNHIRAAGGIVEAVRRVRAASSPLSIEVEAQSLREVDDALAARADVIMLDNLDDETMREAIRRIAGRAQIEISGVVTLDRIPVLATMGADWVSVGALTHSAPAADFSLDIEIR